MNKKELWKKQQEYTKNNYKRYSLKVRKDKKEVIKKLDKQKSKNGYIISLIEKDIKKEE